MKNRLLVLSCVVVCGVLAGCAPAKAPRAATTVLQEEEVRVRVDADGRTQVGSGESNGGHASPAP